MKFSLVVSKAWKATNECFRAEDVVRPLSTGKSALRAGLFDRPLAKLLYILHFKWVTVRDTGLRAPWYGDLRGSIFSVHLLWQVSEHAIKSQPKHLATIFYFKIRHYSAINLQILNIQHGFTVYAEKLTKVEEGSLPHQRRSTSTPSKTLKRFISDNHCTPITVIHTKVSECAVQVWC